MIRLLFFVAITVATVCAQFGVPPEGWDDFKFGLVSNGVAYDPANPLSFDTHRLKTAVEDLGIRIDYRYRYVNEGVDPSKNACVNLFQWKWDADYSKHAMRDAGVQSAYVIYVLQEEGGRVKMLENMQDPIKMQQFFHTLRIVAEHAKGYGATIIVEPDTWGYFMQEHYGNVEDMSLEIDPRKIPAIVNNIPDTIVLDSFYVIPNPDEPWEKDIEWREKEISFKYLSDLPNNMAGFGRAIIRTMHKFAPDCYVGFLASHWSVNLGLNGNGWSSDGMVWSSPELLDTSAKLNIQFFERLYFGSISEESPELPGDRPDFIGVEKNGWCAGTWSTQSNDNRTYWFWGDEQMENYLRWVKQVGEGLDLPVLGWQISIGNMDNNNTFGWETMSNSFQDTYFPYFFKNVDKFIDAGFIGMLVGKGLSQGTDYTLPGEGVGENGWFFSQLMEFDKGRPYLTPRETSIITDKPLSQNRAAAPQITVEGGNIKLSFKEENSSVMRATLYNLRGQVVQQKESALVGGRFFLQTPPSGIYLLKIEGDKGKHISQIAISR